MKTVRITFIGKGKNAQSIIQDIESNGREAIIEEIKDSPDLINFLCADEFDVDVEVENPQ